MKILKKIIALIHIHKVLHWDSKKMYYQGELPTGDSLILLFGTVPVVSQLPLLCKVRCEQRRAANYGMNTYMCMKELQDTHTQLVLHFLFSLK